MSKPHLMPEGFGTFPGESCTLCPNHTWVRERFGHFSCKTLLYVKFLPYFAVFWTFSHKILYLFPIRSDFGRVLYISFMKTEVYFQTAPDAGGVWNISLWKLYFMSKPHLISKLLWTFAFEKLYFFPISAWFWSFLEHFPVKAVLMSKSHLIPRLLWTFSCEKPCIFPISLYNRQISHTLFQIPRIFHSPKPLHTAKSDTYKKKQFIPNCPLLPYIS